ncbi:MAG: FmdB family zinc ribbon protein [Fimbriimonadaceae bacterium]
MPTYVYECKQCEKTFEVEQRIIEDPLKDCGCGGKGTLKRLIQPTAVMFKGSGFYVNDSSKAPAEPACTGEPAACPACKPETKAAP